MHTPADMVEAPQVPAPPELVERAEALVRKYNSQCFWFRHPDACVASVEDVKLVIQRLREYGNHNAWKDAQELSRCL